MKQIAILGATASGKSALSQEWAEKENAIILSVDSLSIYKEIDIVSAKPSAKELQDFKHFGINEIYPNENFNAMDFAKLYEKAYSYAQKNNKNLIIVGGTSFYLKALVTGLSFKPNISQTTAKQTHTMLENLEEAYRFVMEKDVEYISKIEINDKFRLQKWFDIYFETGLITTEFFKQHKPKSLIKGKLDIYNIVVDREVLRNKIKQRTQIMFDLGLVEEVKYLEQKYGRDHKSFNSIGIKECFDYLDDKISKPEMLELISIHTAQLAKRQRTFNKNQFKNIQNIEA